MRKKLFLNILHKKNYSKQTNSIDSDIKKLERKILKIDNIQMNI